MTKTTCYTTIAKYNFTELFKLINDAMDLVGGSNNAWAQKNIAQLTLPLNWNWLKVTNVCGRTVGAIPLQTRQMIGHYLIRRFWSYWPCFS